MPTELKINSIDLFITEKCNLKCSYCFHKQEDSELTIEQGRKILSALYEKYPDKMFINFFGGEPLLYPKTVIALMEYAKTLWQQLTFGISTNGTIFDEELFQYFLDNKMKMQVSCDGDVATQNEMRGEAELVHSNIKKILKYFPKLCVRLTYTPENVANLYDNVLFLHKLGVKKVMHQAVIEGGWGDDQILEYHNQYKLLYHYKRYHRDLEIEFIDKNIRICNGDQYVAPNFCEAGKTLIAILPNGDVYPCHRAASNKIFKLGNILDGKKIIRGVFLNINKHSLNCSKNCPAHLTCHSCIMVHHIVNNNIQEPIMQYCKLMMAEFQGAESIKHIDKEDKQNHLLNSMAKVLVDISTRLEKIENDKHSTSNSDDNSIDNDISNST
jgi:uncharacterized protein